MHNILNCLSLITIFEYNTGALKLNLTDIDHEESLIVPNKGGNCVNWIVGHLIVTRDTLLKLIGDKGIGEFEGKSFYQHSMDGINVKDAVNLEKLKLIFHASQSHVRTGLNRVSKYPDPKLIKTISSLAFHETYHIGQLGILRRVLGKEGMIR